MYSFSQCSRDGWPTVLSCGYNAFLPAILLTALLNDVLDAAHWPSIFSGFAYSLFAESFVNASWQGFTLYDLLVFPGTPFLIWLFERLDPQRGCSMLLAVLCGVVFSICSNIVYVVFLFPFLVFWFIVVAAKRTLRFWLMIAMFAAGYVLMESPEVLAFYLNGPMSHRSTYQLLTDGISSGWSLVLRQSLGGLYTFVDDNIISVLIVLAGLFLILRNAIQRAVENRGAPKCGFQLPRQNTGGSRNPRERGAEPLRAISSDMVDSERARCGHFFAALGPLSVATCFGSLIGFYAGVQSFKALSFCAVSAYCVCRPVSAKHREGMAGSWT